MLMSQRPKGDQSRVPRFTRPDRPALKYTIMVTADDTLTDVCRPKCESAWPEKLRETAVTSNDVTRPDIEYSQRDEIS